MSSKPITLLKVLLHGDIQINEIVKYVDLDINSIERHINILNEYLKQKGIDSIKKVNNNYILKNKDEKFSDFFSKIDILSSKERQDIYCIRLLLDGFINLEKEREKIGVSRTTAIKDLKKVKEFLDQKEIKTESKNSKGIFLKNPKIQDLYDVLCEKIMKLLIDRDFLCKQRKEMLEELIVIDEKSYLEFYYHITSKFDLKKSLISFYAFYSMAIIEKIKGKIDYNLNGLENHKEYEEIILGLEEINYPLEVSSEFKKFIASVVLKIKYNYELDLELKIGYERFKAKIKETFNILDSQDKELDKHLINFYTLGYTDKKFGVLWVRKNPQSERCSRLAKIVEKILKDLEIEMIYPDILRLSSGVTSFFMKNEYNEDYKVLCVSRDINNEYSKRVIDSLKVFYPKVIFINESFLEFMFKSKKEIKNYDLIISDTENYSVENLKRVNTLTLREIQRCFIENTLDKRLNNIKSL